jgi:hypothetical protein
MTTSPLVPKLSTRHLPHATYISTTHSFPIQPSHIVKHDVGGDVPHASHLNQQAVEVHGLSCRRCDDNWIKSTIRILIEEFFILDDHIVENYQGLPCFAEALMTP